VDFTRLRLSGFKSFVDPTELIIEKGLTGVVGPNGCGKSNLLEALRWVMGEKSAKSMRGNGMDDVIFSGTASRPARNLSEVTLSIENTRRTAPTAFNDEAILEISRRIERESGSAYRLNGKEIRAKDVQLLFADASTGAHSPSLVSQGRIGSLINAKPQERRLVLEEAAGISGLHSRRKEAESKLRSAENNLERLGDVEIQLHEQIRSLKKQARQAVRYKKISAEIRSLQALILYLEWVGLQNHMQQTGDEARISLRRVSEVTTELAKGNKEQAILAAALPEIRNNEAEISAKLHRYSVSRDGLDGEERRLQETQEKLKNLLLQIDQDEGREKNVISDTASVVERLQAEMAEIKQTIAAQSANVDQLAEILTEKQTATLDSEWTLEDLTQKQAQRNAEKDTLLRNLEETQNRLDNLNQQKITIEERLGRLESNNLFTQALSLAENNLATAEKAIEEASKQARTAEDQRQLIQQKEQDGREILQAAQGKFAKISAEKKALEEILSADLDDNIRPIMDKLSVEPGYEAALGAALDSDLEASDDEEAPRHWRDLKAFNPVPSLPKACSVLTDHVTGCDILARRLSQVGVVENSDMALSLMKELKPGQRLVSRAGGQWRWDGLCISVEAPTSAAIKFSQKNRLQILTQDFTAQQDQVDKARTQCEAIGRELEEIKQTSRDARAQWRQAEEKAAKARRALTDAEQQATRHQSEESALKDRYERLTEEISEVESRFEESSNGLKTLPQGDVFENEIQQARQMVEQKRQDLSEARLAHDSFTSQATVRAQRLEQIEGELSAWNLRVASAEEHLAELLERREKSKADLKALEDRPGQIVEERRVLNKLIDEAEEARALAAKKLFEAEENISVIEKKIRETQEELTAAREQKVRLETNLEQYQEQQDHLKRRIAEDFDCQPPGLKNLTVLKEMTESEEEQALPDSEMSHHRLEKLKAERERLGAVNLRAETELGEIEESLNASISEREDLENAIGRLRKAISDLNREGRARMLTAFEEVNTHFKELFKTLFGGGEAHLELTESDDPLSAGLEIMASPPGKKMQNLGLLSGGEQALTALSLIFAVFMTNPSPICVLDEVDAPLDDANVERFCDLLDEMNAQTATRFLIVTHNAVTMSRMNRLFGVTMAERGVSQLVSVDLESAEKIRDRASDSLQAPA